MSSLDSHSDDVKNSSVQAMISLGGVGSSHNLKTTSVVALVVVDVARLVVVAGHGAYRAKSVRCRFPQMLEKDGPPTPPCSQNSFPGSLGVQ